MAGRRVQPEVQKLFDKYQTTSVPGRRLGHEDALRLLQTEYELDERHARSVLLYFDADKNGSLSPWEFQHFHTLAGDRVLEIAREFDSHDGDGGGILTREQMSEVLRQKQSADGQDLGDMDITMLLKTAKDEEKIFLGDFIAILYRLKMYRKPPAKGK